MIPLQNIWYFVYALVFEITNWWTDNPSSFWNILHIHLPNIHFTPCWNINDYIPVPICIESVVIFFVKQRNSINIQAEVASVFTMIIDKTW